jgi:hypothetical protein
MTDNWYDLKDALDRMAKLPPRTDFHITEGLADKVKNELDRLKARGFPAPKLLTEEDGDLSLVWRSAGFSIYYVISVGEEPYFSVLTTTAPAPQDILDWIKTLPKEPNEKLREAWAMYQAAVKQPALAPEPVIDNDSPLRRHAKAEYPQPAPAPDVAGLVEAATSLLSAVDAYANTAPQSSAEALASVDVATAAEAVRAALAAMEAGRG